MLLTGTHSPVEMLLRWAARGNDRTMQFGAELGIDLRQDGQGSHGR